MNLPFSTEYEVFIIKLVFILKPLDPPGPLVTPLPVYIGLHVTDSK